MKPNLKDPMSKPIQVEGVPPHYPSDKGWRFVMLCGDCLRVIAEKTETNPNTDSWRWVGKSPPLLCDFCGHQNGRTNPDKLGTLWKGIHAVARYHSEAFFFNPFSWGKGWWEVRDFDKYMKEK